jgi:hypothetical protein
LTGLNLSHVTTTFFYHMYKHLLYFTTLSSKKSCDGGSYSTWFDLLWCCGLFFCPLLNHCFSRWRGVVGAYDCNLILIECLNHTMVLELCKSLLFVYIISYVYAFQYFLIVKKYVSFSLGINSYWFFFLFLRRY